MRIDKITTKNGQAWVTFQNEAGEYMGTLHLIKEEFLEEVKEAHKTSGGKSYDKH